MIFFVPKKHVVFTYLNNIVNENKICNSNCESYAKSMGDLYETVTHKKAGLKIIEVCIMEK